MKRSVNNFENLLALHAAIEYEKPVETAFKIVEFRAKDIYDMPKFPWTKEDLEDVIRLYAAGIKAKEIAEMYGVSQNSIWHSMWRYKKKYGEMKL